MRQDINESAFDDWEKTDLNNLEVKLGYATFDKKITLEEDKRVREMLKCNDPESVELSKIIIENLNTTDNGENRKEKQDS